MPVEVDDESGMSIDVARLVAQGEFLLAELGLHPESELSILLVDQERMAELHVEWMDEPGPTDVLSFPMDEMSEGDAEPGMLGDIVLCPSFEPELDLMLTHGVLHLLGHDHAEEEEKAIMFGKQAALLEAWRSRA